MDSVHTTYMFTKCDVNCQAATFMIQIIVGIGQVARQSLVLSLHKAVHKFLFR